MFGQRTLSQPTTSCEIMLNVTEVNKRDNWLELKVDTDVNAKSTSTVSEHKINTSVTIGLKVLLAKVTAFASRTSVDVYNRGTLGVQIPNESYKILLFFKFVKTDSNDETIYSIMCNSIGLGLLDKTFSTDNESWFLVHESASSKLSFNIIFTTRIIKSENPFKALYEDTDLVDYKLVGESGTEVRVHGAVLAAQSPSIMKMIQEKTIKDNTIEYSGVKDKTLQDFKSYIYLYTLPTEDIEQLLLLASRAAMVELERKCIAQIMASLTPSNVYRITEFAQQHKIPELYLNVLDYIQNGKIKVTDIRSCLKLADV
ncbi:PREDICTED: uncharacterized protein LOC106101393 isoform X2 [Papilio polytes]|uniref:uncharacterized protein LOC106101393 isoform X2 n=1 Tax=Papilio polytes TaxID=76194 RepID=UPI0006761A50|nr:PREDICTED: uncharacterized protein LOC106101393 isoform X2 [Papilio polytes]